MARDSDVVITGMGVVCAAGQGLDAYRSAALAGRSGVVTIDEFKSDDLPVRIAGMARNLNAGRVLSLDEQERTSRASKLCVVAAAEALGPEPDACLLNRNQVGVVMGVCSGGVEVLSQQIEKFSGQGPEALDAAAVPLLMDNAAAAWVAHKWRIGGPSWCVATACATSMDCLGIGYDLVNSGQLQACIAGGGDAAVDRFSISAFANARALSRNNTAPELASRPFDKERDGFVLGEGAAVFFLERRERAMRRGAPIIATLCGYGVSNDAHHLTSPRPDGSGLAMAMRYALMSAGIGAHEVDYVSAHATSTAQGDMAEAAAIRNVFAGRADEVRVGATKSLYGHCVGGAGGISSVAAVFAVSEGWLTPCINYRTPDPECNIHVVSRPGERMSVRYAMANAAGFGGQNSTLVFGSA
jgi:3-oxoacyl-[acyl-carrier-protein] synthase II